MMDWDDLKVFLAVQRNASVRAAAEALGLSHSTVSRRLQTLEAALGARLFLRRAEGLALTETGSDLVAHAEQIESGVQAMTLAVLGRDAQLSGRVRLSLPPPLAQHLIMPILADFATAYPEIDLEVISTYGFTDLDRQHADIAIRFQAEPDRHLVGRRLPDMAYSVYASPAYIARHQFQGPDADAVWILWKESDRALPWFARTPFPDCGFGPIIPDPLSQIAAARAGLGMVYTMCLIGDADPGLARVPGAGVMQDRTGWILAHPDARSSHRVRVCMAHLANGIARHRAALAGDLALAAAEVSA